MVAVPHSLCDFVDERIFEDYREINHAALAAGFAFVFHYKAVKINQVEELAAHPNVFKKVCYQDEYLLTSLYLYLFLRLFPRATEDDRTLILRGVA